MTNIKTRKKIWLINRDFQLRFAGAGLIAGIVSTLITAVIILYPLFAFKILTVGMFLPPPVFAFIGLAVVLNAIMQLLFGIILTHRVAGPMYSMVRYLRTIQGGRWVVAMRQRKGDELEMVVRHLNEMSESLALAVQHDLDALIALRSRVDLLTGSLEEKTAILSAIDSQAQVLLSRIERD